MKRTIMYSMLMAALASSYSQVSAQNVETISATITQQASTVGFMLSQSAAFPDHPEWPVFSEFTTNPEQTCKKYGYYWDNYSYPQNWNSAEQAAGGTCRYYNGSGTIYLNWSSMCEDGKAPDHLGWGQYQCRWVPSCPDSSWSLSEDQTTCSRPLPEERANADCTKSCGTNKQECVGNPIHIGTGNKTESTLDLSFASAPELNLWRTYNSRYLPSLRETFPWKHNFQRRLTTPKNQTAHVERSGGQLAIFTYKDGQWLPQYSTTDRLIRLKDTQGNPAGWIFTDSTSGQQEHYSEKGLLKLIAYPDGNALVLTYSDGVAGQYVDEKGNLVPLILPEQLLVSVTNSLGQSLKFAYMEFNQLAYVEGPDGRRVHYLYQDRRLKGAVRPDGSQQLYLYENTRHPSALTGIINEIGQRSLSVLYDNKGRAISTVHAEGNDLYQVSYDGSGQSTVTDPLGTKRTYTLDSYSGKIKTTSLTQPCPSGCSQSSKHTDYNDKGNPIRSIDWEDNVTETRYNDRQLPIRVTEGLKDSKGTSVVQPETRTTLTEWHDSLPVALVISEYTGSTDSQNKPLGALQRTIRHTYDTQGNLLTRTETDSAGQNPRTTTYTYTSRGRVLTEKDPNGNITRYSYHSDTDAHIGRRGQLHTVTDAVGQVTTYAEYNLSGQPTLITLPNGLIRSLSYDLKGRLIAQKEGERTAQYQYLATGQLSQYTAADGGITRYGYDKAGRLIAIIDPQGNTTEYQLDNLGNRIKTTFKNAAGEPVKQLSQTYNALNQLINITE